MTPLDQRQRSPARKTEAIPMLVVLTASRAYQAVANGDRLGKWNVSSHARQMQDHHDTLGL